MATHDLTKVVIPFHLEDVSTSGQIFVPIGDEHQGEIIEVRTALNGAIITADAVLTLKINGTAVTNGVVTITQSGSAAGDVDTARPTGANTVRAGDAIEIETNGASGNVVEVLGMITIKR